MDNPDLRWELISRYISGEASEEERRRVEEWMAADSGNKEMILLLQEAWESSDQPEDTWDVDSAWLRYNLRYGKDFNDDQGSRKLPDEMNYTREIGARLQKSNNLRWGAVVAAAAIICIAFLFGYQLDGKTSSEQATLTRDIVANYGQRIHLRLSDGTKVILNSGSQISTPETFSDSVRSIQLKGEAFFDVVTDSTRPFMIHTAHSVTEVLGTRFSVKAYSADEQVQVVVQEGRVALRKSGKKGQAAAKEITRSQMGTLSSGGEPAIKELNDVKSYLGWTQGKLVFSEDPLNQVEIKLERWYDIEVEIRPDGLTNSSHRLTATFTDQQPMSEVMEAIMLSLGLNYKQSTSDGTYIIYK